MNNQVIKISYLKQVAVGGNEMVDRALTAGIRGNISVRDPEAILLYNKPSGTVCSEITMEDK